MENSKKGKAFRPLSPEEYIRTKSGTLPIYQCLINSDWENAHLANIIIARKHPEGNITACLYLVDLYCQGVKDTTWFFNKPVTEYNGIMQDINNRLEMEETEYALVHNIIYAALEFAEDYDFHPHRDFTSVSRFMLEEDTDDTELVDIECGMDGKPAYVWTPEHSKSETQRIISKLEKNPGPGNYYILNQE
ncbi:MAG TPA: hypothetical protein PLV06_14415 [Bacteroidales bacterium]|nr:hypothetical protein [Bacteroidales bacterium]HPJ60306.1 hypothetical protein [Bacteroidales bacterium]HPR13579.1 hypothetical protein [Bacteroidales bacterium]HRW86573.1 hypothetical protein [Bacteroidales bacterium]